MLERIEDYIRHNITPPKELEQECMDRGFVKQDTKTWRQQIRERDAFDILNEVVKSYNYRLQQWDPHAGTIALSRKEYEKAVQPTTREEGQNVILRGSELQGTVSGLSVGANLEEVVVTGYGNSRKRALGYSATTIQHSRNGFFSFGKVEQILVGRVSGLQVHPGAAGVLGSQSVSIRGSRSFGSNQPLYVIDGMPVEGDINVLISPNDISNIVVLKDAGASAIYGGAAAHGVIVINTKKHQDYNHAYYQRNRKYKLKDMEDEDYVQALKNVPNREKMQVYHDLEKQYGENATFYMEVAQHLYASGLAKEAVKVLGNAAEISNGDFGVLRAVAFVLESWNQFDKAAEIFRSLLQQYPQMLPLYRDLAWADYRMGRVQEAVNLLYTGITSNFETSEYYFRDEKLMMLSEMNAMIAIHKDKLQLDHIPVELLKPMTSDLRIVVDGNCNFWGMKIQESGDDAGKKAGGSKVPSNKYSYNPYQWTDYLNEYQVKQAKAGKYKVSVNYYQWGASGLPQVIRIVAFKNFGKDNQRIEVQNVIMNNQSGEIEIGEVEWR